MPDSLVAQLAQLFDDGGVALLHAAEVRDWDEALTEVGVSADDPIDALGELRDRWEMEGAWDLALACTQVRVAHLRTELGEGSAVTLSEVARTGVLLLAAGQADEGIRIVEESWQAVVEVAEPGNVHRGRVAAIFGRLRVFQDRAAEAIFPLREAMKVLPAHDPDAAGDAAFTLGRVMMDFGSPEEGLRLIESAVRQARDAEVVGPALPERLAVLAPLVAQRLPPKSAEAVFRESVEAASLVFGDQSAEYASAQASLGGLLLQVPERLHEGLGLMDAAVLLMLGSVGAEDPGTRRTAALLAERLIDVGRAALARRDRDLAENCVARAEAVVLLVFGPEDARLHRIRELAERL